MADGPTAGLDNLSNMLTDTGDDGAFSWSLGVEVMKRLTGPEVSDGMERLRDAGTESQCPHNDGGSSAEFSHHSRVHAQ